MTRWELTRHLEEVALVQLPPHASVPRWALDETIEAPLWSVTRTADELSIICGYESLPGSVTAVGPFIAFSIDGPLDHSLVGVLAGLLSPLADAKVSIIAQSTFDTDWILVPSGQADEAVEVWTESGHHVDVEEEQ